MPPEHHDRPQCGSSNGNHSSSVLQQSQQQPQQQPAAPQQITSNGAGRLFYLKPALRNCFACVGATDRQYAWKEVLNLLRDYINRKNIIDPHDKYKIDLKKTNDPLSLVLGVDSFLYWDVKKLFSEQVEVAVINGNTVPILREPPVNTTQPSTSGNSRIFIPYTSLNWKSCVPEVPAPKPDDIESIYSYQGYETVSCHDTEYEETELEESEFEEYEIASDDDAPEANVPSDDDESDVEVFNIEIYDREESESDFADEDSNSSDEDPDLEDFKWACLTCGEKNGPFVNYCEQCWKVRKDILPDRPKRTKRRKPRIKKRTRKLTDKTNEVLNSVNILENKIFPPANFDRSVSLDDACMSKNKSEDCITNDLKSRTIDYTSSQDSGIGSQDLFAEEYIPEIKMSDKETTEDLVEPSCSKDDGKGKSLKKRQRRSSSEESETAKKIKIDSSEKIEVKDWGALLETESFKEWLSSEEGNRFLSSKSEINATMLMHSSSAGETSKPSGLSTLCSICLHRPKNGSIVHGRISHISTCYSCAKRLLDTGSRCPVCRRKIHMVTKTIVA